MRVFVCEFVTGGGLRDQDLPDTLLPEGLLMRDALLADLSALPGLGALLCAHDDRLAAPVAGSIAVSAGDDPWRMWAGLAARADIVWPVAPETGGLLARMVDLFGASEAHLVACSRPAIAAATLKSETARRLAAAGLPFIPTFAPDRVPAALDGPFLTKPDDGAGCEDTRIWHARADLPQTPGLVAQPYVAGEPLSLSVLVGEHGAELLTVNRQNVVDTDGALSLRGLTVGALADTDGTYARLAGAVVAAFPGLCGIIGIDLIATPRGPVVVEVNPRITTAYAGLHAALGINPASLLPVFARRGAARRPVPAARPVAVELR